jgi:hypothetical protein
LGILHQARQVGVRQNFFLGAALVDIFLQGLEGAIPSLGEFINLDVL